MKISFADTRPTGDYALVLPVAAKARPGIEALGDGKGAAEAAMKRQRFDGGADESAEFYGSDGHRVVTIGTWRREADLTLRRNWAAVRSRNC